MVRTVLDGRSVAINLEQGDLGRIQEVITLSWAESTRDTYGSGLLVYHIFCDVKEIDKDHRAPASPVLMASFVATLTGAYAGATIANYVYGVRAWHLIHGVPWQMLDAKVEALLTAARKEAPETLRRKKHQPYTIDFMLKIRSKLDLSIPLHAAVYAWWCISFEGQGDG